MAQDVTIEIATHRGIVVETEPTPTTIDVALPSPAGSLQIPLAHPDVSVDARAAVVIVQLGLL